MILFDPISSIDSIDFKSNQIEPLIIPQEKLDELKTVLANPKLADVHKHTVMRQISGTCHSCGEKIPLHIVKYRMRGITVIEKYCDDCLRRFNT